MVDFISQNAGNIVIGALVLGAVILAALRVRKTQKSGGCGCGCDGCSHASAGCPSGQEH